MTYTSSLLRLLDERGYIHQLTDAEGLDKLANTQVVPGYIELNFSPSGQWATYRFSGYREGMAEALDIAVKPLAMGWQKSSVRFWLVAEVQFPELILAKEWQLGLAAVIEGTDGTKSYWALAHPPGQPDFHHPACFAATLPPPE